MSIKNKKVFMLLLSLIICIFIVGIIGETGVIGLSKDTTVYIGPRSIYNTNYFCVHHGEDIIGQNYKVTTNFIEVTDPTLNYILCYGSRSAVKGYWVNETQVALWRYLYNNRDSQNTDITNILTGIRNDIDNVCSTDNLYNTDYVNGIELYNEAVEYGNSANNVDVKMIVDERTDTSITFTVTGDYERFEVYTNNNLYKSYETKDNKTITLTGITESTKIKVTAYKTVPKAKYQVLKATDKTNKDVSQRIIIVNKSYDEISDTTTKLFKPELDVSLQKYIVAVKKAEDGKTYSVGEKGGITNNEYNGQNNRRRMWTKENEKSKRVKYDIAKGVTVESDNYKYDNPVEIATGDEVIYKIVVHNNNKKAIENIKVTDRFPNIDDEMCVDIKNFKVEWKNKDGNLTRDSLYTEKWSDYWIKKEDTTLPEYIYTLDFENNESRADIYITVKFNSYKSGKIVNTAWVNVDNNQKTYRTLDRDYVQFETDVSIQKYIVSVDGKSVNTAGVPTNNNYDHTNANQRHRKEMRTSTTDDINGLYKDQISNYKDHRFKYDEAKGYKQEKPVKVEVGSTVEYRITVYNNSPIKANDITILDTLPTYKNNSCVNVISLTHYKEDGSELKSFTDNDWIFDEDKNTISWSTDLDGYSLNYFIMKVEFVSGKGIIENKVEITDVAGGNAGTCRTADKDYVQVTEVVNNETNVSIQKYITKTTSKDYGYTRKKQMTIEGDNEKVKQAISKSITAVNGRYKYAEPVEVKNGEEVTYRISVYNNSSKEVNNIIIEDYLPTSCTTEVVKITQGNGNTDIKDSWIKKNGNTLSYASLSLGAEEETFFLITIKVDGGTNEGLHTNSAAVIVDGNKGNYRTLDRDYIKIVQPDVSLQKYIIRTTTKDLNYSRNNQMTSDRDDGRVKENISKEISADTSKFKKNDPVVVANGEDVTYRISVYNNSTIVAKNVGIEDILPDCATEVKKITQEKDNTDIKDSWTQNDNKLSYTIPSIEANGETYFLVTVEVKNAAANTLYENTAKVNYSGNAGNYRTIDRDYFVIGNYSVSLEKFVSKVEGVDVSPTRSGHRHNEILNDGDGNKSNWKKSTDNGGAGPVIAEAGDKITYTIRLKNTGSQPVKITQIYDSFTFNEEGGSENYLLRYVDSYGIKATYNNETRDNYGTIIDEHYGEVNNSEPKLNRYLIEFADADAIVLQKDKYVDVTIQFELYVSPEVTSQGKSFSNKAGIVEIKDEKNYEVIDMDGTENNYDMDWVSLNKKYSVRLEKYVTKVNGLETLAPTAERAGHPIYEDANYKKDRAVKVYFDNYVTYTIKLINTGTNHNEYGIIKDIVVKDETPTGLTYSRCDGATKIKEDTYKYNGEIPVGESRYFTITYKVNNGLQNGALIENTAEIITPICNKNGVEVDDSDGPNNNKDKDWLTIPNSNEYSVSLEKVVSKVNGVDITGRLGYRYNEDLQATDGSPNKSLYKRSNPVEVENGDIVTFKIIVKNESVFPVKVTQIYDSFGYSRDTFNINTDASNPKKVGLVKEEAISASSGVSAKWDGGYLTNEYPTDANYERYLITLSGDTTLDGLGDSFEIYVKYKVEIPQNLLSEKPRLLFNKAGIVSIFDRNGGDISSKEYSGDNRDQDWIKAGIYSVSLEKYVTKVNGSTDINPNVPREGYRYNDALADGDVNKNMQKPTNKVEVELKDDVRETVTFTIKLQNTGNMPVKVTEIYDTYGYNDTSINVITGGRKNVGFKFDINSTDNAAVRDQYGISVTENYASDEYPIGAYFERSLLKLSRNNILQPGNVKTIDLVFEVEIPEDYSFGNKELVLFNKAGINRIENNYKAVSDADGTDNNADKDWVKILENKLYQIRLEKYVTQVKHNNIVTSMEPNVTRAGHPVYNDPQKENPYKKDNAVKVYLGDYVTYTIRLINTGTDPNEYGSIKNIKVQDNTPAGLTYVGCTNANKLSEGIFVYNNEIAVRGFADFTITYRVNSGLEEGTLIENIAIVTEICNKNGVMVEDKDGPDNNIDKDWIRTRRTAVELQKYITKVYSPGTGENVYYTGRENHRYNEDYDRLVFKTDTALAKNYNQYKPNNKVKVEVGDIVTFTIKLHNTGEMPVKVTQIYESFRYYSDGQMNGTGLRYVEGTISGGNGNSYTITHGYDDANDSNKEVDRFLIDFNNAVQLGLNGEVEFTIDFEVISSVAGKIDTLYNKAGITKIEDYYGTTKELSYMGHEPAKDFDGPDNNYDNDYLEIQEYKVSLQKIVYSVNGNENFVSEFGKDPRWNSWESDANKNGVEGQMSTNSNNLYAKHNNPAIVENGNSIIYAIKVKNDGDRKVAISSIEDVLSGTKGSRLTNIFNVDENGNGFMLTAYLNDNKDYIYQHDTERYCKLAYIDNSDFNKGLNIITNIILNPNDELTMYLTGTIKLPNMSTEVIKNEARITGLTNKNNKVVYDTTKANNNDADYFQMRDIIISGKVWNDIALTKEQDSYNGFYNDGEHSLSGIKVKLYRNGVADVIATTTTNVQGQYTFTKDSIKNAGKVTNVCHQNIKGPYQCISGYSGNEHGSNYWSGDYYSYYIVFEYDGVKYTSTKYYDSNDALGVFNTWYNDSNAKEDNSNGKSGLTTRIVFNNSFNPISNSSEINYTTKNETGFIPQSIYSANNAMQASTNKIDLSNIGATEERLQHINLGLRGKDVFDLELTSDVDNVKVTVNNVQGVYKYSNKVKLRQQDLDNEFEDMANIAKEASNTYIDSQEQSLRDTDFNVPSKDPNTGVGYDANQGINDIEVTYKIVVHNTSPTAGTATKIINYYDSKYSRNSDKSKVAYYYKTDVDKNNDNKTWITSDKVADGDSGSGYKSVIINTQATKLEQADKMEIYVVYKLNTPINTTLSGLTKDIPIPTFNMAEIAEYTTECGSDQTEYTRGLIDKDSAPGSANKEQVRTIDTEGQNTATIGGNPTTVGYYFNRNYILDKLKYEDDTYATPTLYFVIPDDDTNNRKITGIVFEDKTITDGETRIKTGNGKLDEGEVGIYGAKVELIEQKDGGIIRKTAVTDKDGRFEFTDFLPGAYIIRYHYGDTYDTVLLNTSGQDGINGKSYNGEDFQATNNNTIVDNMDTNKVNNTPNDWYIYNELEGISTAWDDDARRKEVSENVLAFTVQQMTVLNNMIDGKSAEEAKVTYNDNGTEKTITVDNIIEDTKMFADTQQMVLYVEKPELDENKQIVHKTRFDKYEIANMNFGIAEVPITKVGIEKHVSAFKITDASGKNTLASMVKENDGWKLDGDVIKLDDKIDVQIEDEKLQGARLEITYTITSNIEDPELNYNSTEAVVPTITGIADFVNNNLSYNSSLGNNALYWEVTNYTDIQQTLASQNLPGLMNPKGTIDPDGTKHTTIVKAKSGNPLLLTQSGIGTATITLEKILSSTDVSIDEIITSTVDVSEYYNIVEIIGFNYKNTSTDSSSQNPDPENIMRDRIRNKDRYIVIPGVQHDYATSDILVIHPSTGFSGIDTIYYIIAIISLAVLAAGVFGIKKFVVKK